MSGKLNPLWDEFILWSLTPDVSRGAVSTEVEWARVKGISDRTLRRWKDNPEFAARREELSRVSQVTRVAAATSSVTEVTSADEGDYQVVKATLVDGAKSGNPKYLDLYFRTYGKPFVEEEVAARSASLAGEDLDVLVAEALIVLGEELVAQKLRDVGWTVER
jgi:hypothetical protein